MQVFARSPACSHSHAHKHTQNVWRHIQTFKNGDGISALIQEINCLNGKMEEK